MPGLIESGITLNFPDSNFFRFANCNGYSILSGNNFKEMDACWFDNSENLYWLFELKDYSASAADLYETIEHKSWNIVKKAVDSLCMFLSSKHAYPHGLMINADLPFPPDENTRFKFVTVVHCNESQKADIQLLNEKFKIKFKPYADLFGIKDYSIVEHSIAKRIIPRNIVQ